jgi:uncharacterized protein YgbK (DUF1537 family)
LTLAFFSPAETIRRITMNDTEKLLSIGKTIENLINHSVTMIFNTYMETFVAKENSYIIPAVWGAVKDGELDATQKAIHKDVKQLVENVISALFIKNMTDPQRFALGYLVNRIVIYNISFMNQLAKSAKDSDNRSDPFMLIL